MLNANPIARLLGAVAMLASVLLLAFIVLAAGCRISVSSMMNSDGDLPANAVRARDGDLAATIKKIEVDNRFGDLRVTAAAGAYGWNWKLRAWAKTDALAEDAANQADLTLTTNGDTIRLTVVLPDNFARRRYQSDLEVRVPKSVAVNAENRFGATSITGVDGPVTAHAQNGSMEIRDIADKVEASTTFAHLRVENTGPATLKDQNGDLDASRIQGPLEARTSFAELSATDVRGPLRAHNQNGSVRAEHIGGPADLETSFSELSALDIAGPLTAHNQNASLKAEWVKGNADLTTSFSDLRVNGVEGDATLRDQNGSVRARGVTGFVRATTSFGSMDIEGSGQEFICRDQNGSITIRATSTALTRLEARTSFDALEVRLPSGLKPAIQAHTTFAEIESDFPVVMKPRGQDPFAEADPGTARIILENQNGRIRVQAERVSASR